MNGVEKKFNSIEEMKKGILEAGGIIIGDGKKSFSYMLDGFFGSVCIDSLSGMFKLSSEYIGGKNDGCGAIYGEYFSCTLQQLKNATTKIINPSSTLRWYGSLEEYLVNKFFVFQISVRTKDSVQPAINYISDYYVYISDKHGKTFRKREIDLTKFYNRNDDYQAIFKLDKGKMTIVRSNLSDKAIKALESAETEASKINDFSSLVGAK